MWNSGFQNQQQLPLIAEPFLDHYRGFVEYPQIIMSIYILFHVFLAHEGQ